MTRDEFPGDANEPDLRAAMVAHGKSLFDRGLAPGSSGNLSVRLADGWLMSPTNTCLGRMDPERISRLDGRGKPMDGDPPSKEAHLHIAVYRQRPQAHAIVHLHSVHAVAVSCLADLDAADCIPPLTPYFVMKIGRLPLVPYHRPGAPELAGVIGPVAARNKAFLLANHGPVVADATLDAAVNAAEELEETARLFLLLRGSAVRPLNAAQVEELRRVFHPGSEP